MLRFFQGLNSFPGMFDIIFFIFRGIFQEAAISLESLAVGAVLVQEFGFAKINLGIFRIDFQGVIPVGQGQVEIPFLVVSLPPTMVITWIMPQELMETNVTI
jgi:hypothetical protein